jgi:hypothetical protein
MNLPAPLPSTSSGQALMKEGTFRTHIPLLTKEGLGEVLIPLLTKEGLGEVQTWY